MPFSLHLQIRFFRSLCEVTTGVPSSAKARASEWISPVDTETSRMDRLQLTGQIF